MKVGRVLVDVQTILERAGAFIGAVTLMAMMLLTTTDVGGRYLFNHPVTGAYEIAEFMLVGIIYLGVAYVQSNRGHVKVEMLGEQIFRDLSPKAKVGFDVFGNIIGLSVMALVTWQSGLLAWNAWVTQDFTGGLMKAPLWPAKSALTIGVGLLTTRLLLDIVTDISRLAKGSVPHEP